MSYTTKRGREDFEPDTKKIKNYINQQSHQEITESNEWPQFAHPEGGIVKITPWGSLRQFVDPISGESITKFEDMSFEDYTFKASNVEDIYTVKHQEPPSMPSTPQSLYQTHSYQPNTRFASHNMPGGNSPLRLSPECEAEGYLRDGYRGQQAQQQFEQEHENYFGMHDQQEEFDCSEINYSIEDDEMN
ncbi:uncharacterized protein SPAPADRAFT_144303 [Spathaspora passalidarum NRRL Y-27907]|uniref:Uncharacterized protein n=1 Tax=Spathaspora passalidarum (strain NRRL Y-27907 / 11-Y1) TaxID=619300 RepID=G3AVJ4_SPAPN|nr:uncharacterized protein SPAPADRAFT_144303 [Spathaspora passalidarum NRRL Y-27907]EGW29943.1 hypothetical protein SPAPADRAFT_144303 [Spathaspora passalidarum NRRL Y-27907]